MSKCTPWPFSYTCGLLVYCPNFLLALHRAPELTKVTTAATVGVTEAPLLWCKILVSWDIFFVKSVGLILRLNWTKIWPRRQIKLFWIRTKSWGWYQFTFWASTGLNIMSTLKQDGQRQLQIYNIQYLIQSYRYDLWMNETLSYKLLCVDN